MQYEWSSQQNASLSMSVSRGSDYGYHFLFESYGRLGLAQLIFAVCSAKYDSSCNAAASSFTRGNCRCPSGHLFSLSTPSRSGCQCSAERDLALQSWYWTIFIIVYHSIIPEPLTEDPCIPGKSLTFIVGTRGLNLGVSWFRTSMSSCWCLHTFLIFMMRTMAAWMRSLRSSSMCLWVSSCSICEQEPYML